MILIKPSKEKTETEKKRRYGINLNEKPSLTIVMTIMETRKIEVIDLINKSYNRT
jgi:hypothetical protein